MNKLNVNNKALKDEADKSKEFKAYIQKNKKNLQNNKTTKKG